jgi:hypothetical protein
VADSGRTAAERPLAEGRWVQVRNRLNGKWSPGFVVDGVEEDGYRLRRARDGGILPSLFRPEDVRPIS